MAPVSSTTTQDESPPPGLAELGEEGAADPLHHGSTVGLSDLSTGPDGVSALVRRIGESVQADSRLLGALRHAGVRPGAVVSVTSSPGGVTVGSDRVTAALPVSAAAHVFVAKP